MSRIRVLAASCLALLAALALAAPALAKQQPREFEVGHVEYPGLKHLHYRYGPISVTPGQNTIEFHVNDLKPKVPGYITRFKPNLTYTDGTVPRVDVIHLHHGVWLARNYPTFAAGEEKTIFQLPKGFGYPYQPKDPWIMNYMVHNLTEGRAKVYITYDIDFLPASTPAAKQMKTALPLWMDVAGIKAYPVFDVHRGDGKNGRYTFPEDARGAERQKIGPAHQYPVTQPMTLLATAGHLHPGGLWDDLKVVRDGQKKLLFRSKAHYYEPAGAVSWDVSLTATNPNWRVRLDPGDLLKVSATYDSSKASWYESMGIMVVWYHPGTDGGGVDPFTHELDTHGRLTHGHLPENDNHGGRPAGLPNALTLMDGSHATTVDIANFLYTRGDLTLGGRAGRPVIVRQGQPLTFKNLDSPQGLDPAKSIYHTITACRAPCNRTTGIAYPLANGRVDFDSGELGYGPSFATAAANRDTWQTPTNLKPGTYTYFCRIHPFMRGSFRVVKR